MGWADSSVHPMTLLGASCAPIAERANSRTVAGMTTNADSPHTNDLDAPEELERFLRAYQPTGLARPAWATIRDDGVELVLRAGALTRLRVEKDIQLLGAMAAHCHGAGRPISLDEVLSDRTLLSFDTVLRASDKTRENKRGIARRLQSVHRGLPWRAERRADGERVRHLTGPEEIDRLARLEGLARENADPDVEAEAFLRAVDHARALRGRGSKVKSLDDQTWAAARRFATEQGWTMTWPRLCRAMTHEVLGESRPAALLITDVGLTRADLDLALTAAAGLPDAPSEVHQGMLRGRTTSS
jgi:hypothetical protein